MAEQPVDLKITADPSEAVNAAKKVQTEVNNVGESAEKSGKSFDKINNGLIQWSKNALKTLGAMLLIDKALKATVGYVNEAEKLSRALEISYEKAQELTIAEREAGLAAGSIRSAIEGIAQAQAQGMISRDMQNLGFNLSEIADLKPDELFDSLSKRLSEGDLNARQFQAAVNVLGQDGADVALKLAGNFEYFRDVAKESGQVISEEVFEETIEQSDKLLASLKIMGEDVLRLITPFDTFGEAVAKSLGVVNKLIESIRFHMTFLGSYIGARQGGLSDAAATELAAIEALGEDEQVAGRAKQESASRGATENLSEERATGSMAMLDYLTERMNRGSHNISDLQRVGLAATGGESEAIRLQRRQLSKADSIDKQLVKQTNVLTDRL